MLSRKSHLDVRRNPKKRKIREAWRFDVAVLGIVSAIVLAAVATESTHSGLCSASAGGFAGWILVTIGYVPLLLCGAAHLCSGGMVDMPPIDVWHLAVAGGIWIILLWAVVRWMARKRPADFLRRARHIALVVFFWCALQLLVFAAATVWQCSIAQNEAHLFLPAEKSEK